MDIEISRMSSNGVYIFRFEHGLFSYGNDYGDEPDLHPEEAEEVLGEFLKFIKEVKKKYV